MKYSTVTVEQVKCGWILTRHYMLRCYDGKSFMQATEKFVATDGEHMLSMVKKITSMPGKVKRK